MDILSQPDTCYCAAARKTARLLSRVYDRHLASADMTMPQFSLMLLIARAGEITAAELAEKLGMDRTTLVRALKPLQRDGLVVDRRAGPKTRQLVYTLSEKGTAKVGEAMPLWLAAQREIETQMGTQRAEKLREDARDVVASLG
jgi:DNA-binding MarR family transcriptional regulator